MLNELLETRACLLADGATGTNLFDVGLTSGDAPELWNVDQPDKIQALHQSFIDAGSDIILTNSFGGNARRLMLHAADDRVEELNAAAARIARTVAEGAGRPVVVAGSVGPTGDLFAPLGEMTEDAAVEVFKTQITGLLDGGADVIWIETMSADDEMRAAANAAIALGAAYTTTASFDTAGRTMMGLKPDVFATTMIRRANPPVAFGANCGVGASDTLAAILEMTSATPDAVVIAKANAGIPQVQGDQVIYSGSPDLMGDYARLAIDAGVRIIGGCCGSRPAHVAAMRAAIDTHVRGERPDLAAIVAATGDLVAPAAEAGDSDAGDAARRSRRRRRET